MQDMSRARELKGPRYDETLNKQIVDAATQLLTEIGYDEMSMDAVAGLAGVSKATIYRRWASKEALVVETVLARELPIDSTPDTGSLREDLISWFRQLGEHLDAGALRHFVGVIMAMRDHVELQAAINERITASWARGTEEIVARGVTRDEIHSPPAALLDLLAKITPALLILRLFIGDEPVDDELLTRIVDGVLLPALNDVR